MNECAPDHVDTKGQGRRMKVKVEWWIVGQGHTKTGVAFLSSFLGFIFGGGGSLALAAMWGGIPRPEFGGPQPTPIPTALP